MAEAIHLAPSDGVPNSRLPVPVHRGALAPAAGAGDHEALFARHGWTKAWRNGVYPSHHFHSSAHEVLGVCGGHATLRLGGEGGRDVEVRAGDVLVPPAGTGHRRLAASADFGVVGACPDGCDWDLIRAAEVSGEASRQAAERIAAVSLPRMDPVTGAAMDTWR